MRRCMALKAVAARATSSGPSSCRTVLPASGSMASAARASCASGRVAWRTASHTNSVSTTSCSVATSGTAAGSGIGDGLSNIVSGVPSLNVKWMSSRRSRASGAATVLTA